MEYNYEQLFEYAKVARKITWEMEEVEEQELMLQVQDSVSIINDYVGGENDFEAPGLARRLFLDLVRYLANSTTELFINNFMWELNTLRAKVASKKLGEELGTN